MAITPITLPSGQPADLLRLGQREPDDFRPQPVLPLREPLVQLHRAGRGRRLAEPGLGHGLGRPADGRRYGRIPLCLGHGAAAAAAVHQRPVRGLRRRLAPHGRAGGVGRGGHGCAALADQAGGRPGRVRPEVRGETAGHGRRRAGDVSRHLAGGPHHRRRRLPARREPRLQSAVEGDVQDHQGGRLSSGLVVPPGIHQDQPARRAQRADPHGGSVLRLQYGAVTRRWPNCSTSAAFRCFARTPAGPASARTARCLTRRPTSGCR